MVSNGMIPLFPYEFLPHLIFIKSCINKQKKKKKTQIH